MSKEEINDIYEVVRMLNGIPVPTVLLESVALQIRNCAIKLENICKKSLSDLQKVPENGDDLKITDIEVGTVPVNQNN